MNQDRIREIANQASTYAEGMVAPYWGLEDGLDYQARTMEVRDLKFAELMIKEFIDVVENLAPMYDDYRDQIEDRFRRDCISQVKHRFIWSDKE
jgi:hypothetical protein